MLYMIFIMAMFLVLLIGTQLGILQSMFLAIMAVMDEKFLSLSHLEFVGLKFVGTNGWHFRSIAEALLS